MGLRSRTLGLFAGLLLALAGGVASVSAQDDVPRGGEYAITNTGHQIRRWPVVWDLSVDYVFFWYNPRPGFPGLITTGSIADTTPGAFGQPNTVVLQDAAARQPQRPAGQVTFTYFLVDPEAMSIRASFFLIETRSMRQAFSSDATGFPLIARPFFNVDTGAEDAIVLADPGAFVGSASESIRTRIMGADANLRLHTPSIYYSSSGITLFGGMRWFRLEETYESFDTSTDITGAVISRTFSDRFQARNEFWGAQLGVEAQYQFFGITFSAMGKVAAGPVHQTLIISGATSETDLTTGVVTADTQGIYARPSNVGTYRRSRFALMPEAGGKASIPLSHTLSVHVAYSVFSLTEAIRPVDHIDRRVSVVPLGAGTTVGSGFPPPPTFQSHTFVGQMFNIGLELRY